MLTEQQIAFRKQWAAELKSGKYEQNRGTLISESFETIGDTNCLCCLGVAGRLLGMKDARYTQDLRARIEYVTGSNQRHFINMNDFEKLSFDEIADIILAGTDKEH